MVCEGFTASSKEEKFPKVQKDQIWLITASKVKNKDGSSRRMKR